MATKPISRPPSPSEQPTAPSILPTDTRTSEIVLSRLSSSTESSEEGELRVTAAQPAAAQASDVLYEQWIGDGDPLTRLFPGFQNPPNPLALIEIEVHVSPENSPLKFSIPKFALDRFSPVFKNSLAQGWSGGGTRKVVWKLSHPFSHIHPLAAAYVRQRIQCSAGLIERTVGLKDIKVNFKDHPDVFDQIFRDIVRLCELYQLHDVEAWCHRFINAEMKEDPEGKIVHYFHWAFSLPDPLSRPLLNFFQNALVSISVNPDMRMKVWPVLLSLYEADFSSNTAAQKEACQEFLQECFEKTIDLGFTFLDESVAIQFGECLIGMFPRFDFPIALLKKIHFDMLSDSFHHHANPLIYWVSRLITTIKGERIHGYLNFANPNPPPVPVAEGKLKECQLLIEALLEPKGESRIIKLKKIIDQYPDNITARSILAAGYFTSKQYQLALFHNDEVIRKKPNHLEAFYTRGLIYLKGGKREEAIRDFNRVLEIDPNHVQALVQRAECSIVIENYQDAMSDLQRAEKLDPKSPDVHSKMGRCLRRLGQYAEALHSFDLSLQLKPDNPDALSQKGDCLRECGRVEEALAIFTQLLAKHPNDGFCLSRKGDCLRQLGKFDEALVELNRVIDSKLNSGDYAIAFRGLCHFDRGNIASARTDLATALEFAEKLTGSKRPYSKLCDELKTKLEGAQK